MLISLSKGQGSKEADHHGYFRVANVAGESLLKHITNSVWSPLQWRDGKRLNQNFIAASMIALDFDSGDWTVEDTIDFLKMTNYRAIVGLTKSHQKEKVTKTGVVSPACDRFRLLLAIEKPIRSGEAYSFQMRHMESLMPVDKSCKDKARFFYPCTKIVYDGGEKPYPVLSEAELENRRQAQVERDKLRNAQNKGLASMKMLPPRILKVLGHGGIEGKRHVTAYQTAAELSKFGWDMDKVYEAFAKTNLIDIGEHELRRCVQNGYEAARQIEE